MPDDVMGDPTSLQQVVMNLATNAAQAMPAGGDLRVSVEPHYLTDSRARAHPTLKEGPYVALTVSDEGVGITPEDRVRVFDPFFTTKPVGSGTGLGLALVHSIVRDHGGAVDLETEVGVGTTVRCLLPLLEDTAEEASRQSDDASPPRGNGEMVLVVDDEPLLVAGAERRLRSLGYEVRAFSSPMRALEEFARDPSTFDVVVTDLTMPEMGGLELGRTIVGIRPDIPVLLSTGYHEDMDGSTLEASGIVGVVKKPVTVDEMARALRAALEEGGWET